MAYTIGFGTIDGTENALFVMTLPMVSCDQNTFIRFRQRHEPQVLALNNSYRSALHLNQLPTALHLEAYWTLRSVFAVRIRIVARIGKNEADTYSLRYQCRPQLPERSASIGLACIYSGFGGPT